MKKSFTELEKRFQNIIKNETLKNHCTFQVGGKADYFYILKDIKELPKLIKLAKSLRLPYLLIGRGSNLLFSDKGFRGLVIKNETSEIKFYKNSATIDSGVIVSKLVNECMKNGLSPLEKWAGLPGTVGAAVYGNAGCNGLETKDILYSAKILNPKTGKIRDVKNKYFQFKYRSSKLKKSHEILLSATFSVKKSKLSKEEISEIVKKSHQSRLEKQPLGLSSGSFFKNPSLKNPAGMLIDKSGLKGKKTGGAIVSEKHANFLLNTGKATAKDIISLARLVQREVKKRFKVTLTPEVQILSDKGKIITL